MININTKLFVFFLFFMHNISYSQCPPSIMDVSTDIGNTDGTDITIENDACTGVGAGDPAAGLSATNESLGGTVEINGETYASQDICFGNGGEYYSFTGVPGNEVASPASYTIEFGGAIGTCVYTASGALAGPEIIVSSTNEITDGASVTATSTMNGTDFGDICTASGTIDVTYTIANTGTADLTLSGVISMTGSTADFAISQPASSTIPSGQSTTFTVTFSPTSAGQKTATISIPNNDSDENPFDFVIEGTGVNPVITVVAVTSTVPEDSGSLVYQFTRDCGNGDLIVKFALSGTVSSTDFSIDTTSPNVTFDSSNNTGTLKFNGMDTMISLPVVSENDDLVESSESVVITIIQ